MTLSRPRRPGGGDGRRRDRVGAEPVPGAGLLGRCHDRARDPGGQGVLRSTRTASPGSSSEPVLRELLTRSYFWRRAWLFAGPRAGAPVPRAGGRRLGLGPAGAPRARIPLLLSFSRRDGRLIAVRSPRFDLDFASDRSFREASGGRPPVRGEIAWSGPADASGSPTPRSGGGCGRFDSRRRRPSPSSGRPDGGISFPARRQRRRGPARARRRRPTDPSGDLRPEGGKRSGSPSRGTSTAARSPPARRSRSAASRVPESTSRSGQRAGGVGRRRRRDPLSRGRRRARSGSAGRLGLHDPARWVAPAGFNRILVDDDGNRPVTTLRREARSRDCSSASPTGSADLARRARVRRAARDSRARRAADAALGSPGAAADRTRSRRPATRAARLGRRRADRLRVPAAISRLRRHAAPLDLRAAERP